MGVADARVRISRGPAIGWVTVEVPTEDGRIAVVDFYQHREGFWTVDISDELIVTAPEGLTAVLLLAFRQLAEEIAS